MSNPRRVDTSMKQQCVQFKPGDLDTRWRNVIRRRSFLAGLSVTGTALSAGELIAPDNQKLPKGDVAIITFLAAVELVESDMWQQYNELGGVNGGNPAYKLALQNLHRDMPQYISDNTDDEMSHATFLNAYLMSKGETPVNLDEFRTLPSSQATGAKQIRRLTNLMNLDVDTSWYTRYRSTQNPDLGGGPFPQAVHIMNQPAIPVNDADTPPNQLQPVPPANSRQRRMQAIANTAGVHFATFEQAGARVFTNPIPNGSHTVVLRVRPT